MCVYWMACIKSFSCWHLCVLTIDHYSSLNEIAHHVVVMALTLYTWLLLQLVSCLCSENLKFWNDKNYGHKNSCRLLRGSLSCFYFSGDMIGILYRFNKWYLMQTHSNKKARIVCCQTINCSIFIFTLGDCIRCFEARKKKFTFHWQWRGDKSPKWNRNQLSPNENYHKLRDARLKWCHYKSQQIPQMPIAHIRPQDTRHTSQSI